MPLCGRGGSLDGRYLNCLSVYIPPMLSGRTFTDLTGLLSSLPQGATFLVEDFNDVTLPPWIIRVPRVLALDRLAGVVAGWRGLVSAMFGDWDPTSRCYTHTLAAHGSHSPETHSRFRGVAYFGGHDLTLWYLRLCPCPPVRLFGPFRSPSYVSP